MLNYTGIYYQFTIEISSYEDALQFASTVSSVDSFCKNNVDMSSDSAKRDLLKYTLQAEIFSTAKIGCYSGQAIIVHDNITKQISV